MPKQLLHFFVPLQDGHRPPVTNVPLPSHDRQVFFPLHKPHVAIVTSSELSGRHALAAAGNRINIAAESVDCNS